MSEWITVAEIAADLQLSKQTVYRWIKSGEIPGYHFNDTYRVKRDEYQAWRGRQKIQP